MAFNLKQLKRQGICLALALMAASGTAAGAAAYEARELVPMGCAVGIQIQMDGLMVAGMLPVQTKGGNVYPASAAGLGPGDVIIKVGGQTVKNTADFAAAAEKFDGSAVSVTVRRGERLIQYTVTPALNLEGRWQLGLWLRDSVAGIGTVTFYDPATGVYGALGHGVSDPDSGLVMPLGAGSILDATVIDVLPGKVGAPGELHGCFDTGSVRGSIMQNSSFGIFGFMSEKFKGRAAMPVAAEGDIKIGPATILSNMAGTEIREYQAEITRVYKNEISGRCLMLTITDPELLSISGGIVQGMSGSPILQNGKLIGAVTHVQVNDPSKGYGISVERMMSEMENFDEKRAAA